MLRWRVLSASLWSLVSVVFYVHEARWLHFSVLTFFTNASTLRRLLWYPGRLRFGGIGRSL